MNTTAALQIEPSSKAEIGRVTFPNAIPVTPLDFNRDNIIIHEQREIEEAAAFMKQKIDEGYCSGTANWFFSNDKWTNSMEAKYNGACHASLSYHGIDAYSSVFGFENATHRKNNLSYKQAAPFLSWFLYHSPYGEFILNRDDFEYCAKYGFIVSGSIPQPIFMNIAIISRHFWEINSSIFEYFNNCCVDKNLDPTIAYSTLFNSYFSYEGNEAINRKYQCFGGHRVAGAYSPRVLLNIFNGVYGQTVKKGSMAKEKTIYGASSLFNNIDTQLTTFCLNSKKFKNDLRESRGIASKVEAYKPPNPFVRNAAPAAIVLMDGEFTNKEAIDFVIPWLDNYVREELKNNVNN